MLKRLNVRKDTRIFQKTTFSKFQVEKFFPREIMTLSIGLNVSEHRMKLSDSKRFLGFSGSFPAHFVSIYSPKDHPRALLMQECPQQLKDEEKSVFRRPASAQTQR